MSGLPSNLPLFPLTGALLLPRGHLPLNIFEPRYRAMTEAALAEARMIGMIQPLEGKDDAGDPPLYKTGCAGRIVEFRETGDGRYLIALEGVARFDVVEELPKRDLFRRARLDWSRYAGDLGEDDLTGFDPKRFLAALGPYLHSLGATSSPETANIPVARLVTAVAMLAPLASAEKQALLEAGPVERANLLTGLIEMALVAGARVADPARH
jgi:uncharacterized protein